MISPEDKQHMLERLTRLEERDNQRDQTGFNVQKLDQLNIEGNIIICSADERVEPFRAGVIFADLTEPLPTNPLSIPLVRFLKHDDDFDGIRPDPAIDARFMTCIIMSHAEAGGRVLCQIDGIGALKYVYRGTEFDYGDDEAFRAGDKLFAFEESGIVTRPADDDDDEIDIANKAAFQALHNQYDVTDDVVRVKFFFKRGAESILFPISDIVQLSANGTKNKTHDFEKAEKIDHRRLVLDGILDWSATFDASTGLNIETPNPVSGVLVTAVSPPNGAGEAKIFVQDKGGSFDLAWKAPLGVLGPVVNVTGDITDLVLEDGFDSSKTATVDIDFSELPASDPGTEYDVFISSSGGLTSTITLKIFALFVESPTEVKIFEQIYIVEEEATFPMSDASINTEWNFFGVYEDFSGVSDLERDWIGIKIEIVLDNFGASVFATWTYNDLRLFSLDDERTIDEAAP